jgi:hypothetical protein
MAHYKKKKKKIKESINKIDFEYTPLSLTLNMKSIEELMNKGYSFSQAQSVLYKEKISKMFNDDKRLN